MIEADRLLILSCSRRKNPDSRPIPALERYDGPAFNVLRKYRRHTQSTHQPWVYVLSAKFGLISANQPIPDYDLEMTAQRAVELQPEATAKLRTILAERPYKEMFIHTSGTYLQALNGFQKALLPETILTIASGRPGGKLAELRNWLYADFPVPVATQYETKTKGEVYFKGVAITLSAEEILDMAREALAKDEGQAKNYYSWYVLVDDVKVAPKWLVSQVTGNVVNSFNTGQARRVLSQLGVDVVAI